MIGVGPPVLKIQLQYHGVNFPIPEVYFLPNPRYFQPWRGEIRNWNFIDLTSCVRSNIKVNLTIVRFTPSLSYVVFFFFCYFWKTSQWVTLSIFFMGDVIFSYYVCNERVDVVPWPLSRFVFPLHFSVSADRTYLGESCFLSVNYRLLFQFLSDFCQQQTLLGKRMLDSCEMEFWTKMRLNRIDKRTLLKYT